MLQFIVQVSRLYVRLLYFPVLVQFLQLYVLLLQLLCVFVVCVQEALCQPLVFTLQTTQHHQARHYPEDTRVAELQ